LSLASPSLNTFEQYLLTINDSLVNVYVALVLSTIVSVLPLNDARNDSITNDAAWNNVTRDNASKLDVARHDSTWNDANYVGSNDVANDPSSNDEFLRGNNISLRYDVNANDAIISLLSINDLRNSLTN